MGVIKTLQGELEQACFEALDDGLTGKEIIDYMVDKVFPKNIFLEKAVLEKVAEEVYIDVSSAYVDDE